MTKEEIIREEAAEFANYGLEDGSFGYNEHKSFITDLQSELQSYYQPEYKMIYLDEIKEVIKSIIANHKKGCKEEDCYTEKTLEKIVFFVDQEIDELPKIVVENVVPSADERSKVFISYSHNDLEWLNKLKRHFKTFERQIDFWDDSRIQPGQKWKEEITKNIQESKIAILLISADFFNSQFITENELPPLLRSASEDGATILNVILKPCMFEEYPDISQYQAINSPNKTLLQMDEAGQELTWVELVRQVKKITEENSQV